MVFSSVIFLYFFLPLFFLVYYLTPFKWKNLIALAGSLAFYAWGDINHLYLLISAIIGNYVIGLLIDRVDEKRKKLTLILGVLLNLFILGFFKYLNFIFSIFDMEALDIVLPLGISFFTFQALSYLIDVYKGRIPAEKNILNFALYIALFPKLIMGPIVRYTSLGDQFNHRIISFEGVAQGIVRFSIGLGKKAILSGSLGAVADSVFVAGGQPMDALAALLGIVGYSLQLYFDFSGYSDMAIGLASMMGFEFTENFNYPYISKSASEFWRRWHMTLGSWFRDYIYIPLGGNRCSMPRQFFNLSMVWLATGIWHGAGWTFILWGLYYFVFVALERLLKDRLDKLPNIIRHLTTLVIVMAGWILFRSNSLIDAINYYYSFLKFDIDSSSLLLLNDNIVMILIGIVGSTPLMKVIFNRIRELQFMNDKYIFIWIIKAIFVAVILLLSTIYIVNSTYNPFIYFRF